MVRTFKRKTDRINIDEENINKAIDDILHKRLSERQAAAKYDVKRTTIQSRLKKRSSNMSNEMQSTRNNVYASKYTEAQIFIDEQEKLIAEYIIKCSKLHYGLSLTQTRKLAYEYAKKLGIKYPASWDKKKMAGIVWLINFRKRNPSLSLRKAENTSIARPTAFNKTSVDEFFTNLQNVMTKYQFVPARIINCDETGLSTVMEGPKILTDKNLRQVGQTSSRERGELTTMCGIVSAAGNAFPPVFIFPRARFKSCFLNNSIQGSLGLANKSGWMTAQLFTDVLTHIQKCTSSSKDNSILLLLDNHETHITIDAINFARENGIVFLTFPPHTSHKLQPLDISVYGPFKAKMRVAINDWQTNNIGKVLSIYEIAGLAKLAYLSSFSMRNILSGFASPGIYPFNRLAFVDDDFAPCEIYQSSSSPISRYQDEENVETEAANNNELTNDQSRHLAQENPSQHIRVDNAAVACSSTSVVITPETVRPYPKVRPRLVIRRTRNKGKSRVYTDSQEKNEVQMVHDEKQRKKREKEVKERAKQIKSARKLLEIDLPTKKARITRSSRGKNQL